MGGADGKEEGVETEDGTGNTPIPQNTAPGVSTRRTTYVMVGNRKQVVSFESVVKFYSLMHSLIGSVIC